MVRTTSVNRMQSRSSPAPALLWQQRCCRFREADNRDAIQDCPLSLHVLRDPVRNLLLGATAVLAKWIRDVVELGHALTPSSSPTLRTGLFRRVADGGVGG